MAMTGEEIERVLARLPRLAVAVLGDFCLDRYLYLDPAAEDRSLETGLPVRHVVESRSAPGGAGVVLSNLRALGVGRVRPIGFVGRDGEGFELLEALERLEMDCSALRRLAGRPTPAYLKPVVLRPGGVPEELSRFDIFPRRPLPPDEEQFLVRQAAAALEDCDALVVSDYGEGGRCGAVTPAVRGALAELGRRHPGKPLLADSRRNIGEFRNCTVKANEREALRLAGAPEGDGPAPIELLERAGRELAGRNGRPAFITMGARGMIAAEAAGARRLPGYPLRGPVDPVGAGDAAAAALAAALAAGAAPEAAALLAVLAASVTVEQLGVTGTAGPAEVRARLAEYARAFPEEARR